MSWNKWAWLGIAAVALPLLGVMEGRRQKDAEIRTAVKVCQGALVLLDGVPKSEAKYGLFVAPWESGWDKIMTDVPPSAPHTIPGPEVSVLSPPTRAQVGSFIPPRE